MARKQIDFYGFDELSKTFERMAKKYESSSDALLATQATTITKRSRQLTPRVTGNLRKNWRTVKPKDFQGGNVKVAMVVNRANHAHLYEYGHEIYSAPKKTGRVSKHNALGRKVKGIRHHGRVEGRYLLRSVIDESESRMLKSADELMEKVTGEWEK